MSLNTVATANFDQTPVFVSDGTWGSDIACQNEFERVISDYKFEDDLNDDNFLTGDYLWDDE